MFFSHWTEHAFHHSSKTGDSNAHSTWWRIPTEGSQSTVFQSSSTKHGSVTPSNAAAGFRATGIFPFNRDAIKLPQKSECQDAGKSKTIEKGSITFLPLFSPSQSRAEQRSEVITLCWQCCGDEKDSRMKKCVRDATQKTAMTAAVIRSAELDVTSVEGEDLAGMSDPTIEENTWKCLTCTKQQTFNTLEML